MDSYYVRPEKARKYLKELDEARCKGKWSEVPENHRKVEKHGPVRKLLLHTVALEAEMVKRTTSDRRGPQVQNERQVLQQKVNQVTKYTDSGDASDVEDEFQAKVALASVAYWLSRPTDVLEALPHDFVHQLVTLSNEHRVQQTWTYVSLAKAALFRGGAFEKQGKVLEAFQYYESMADFLGTTLLSHYKEDEYQLWYERFLSQYCLLAGYHVSANRYTPTFITSKDAVLSPILILKPFRAWTKFLSSSFKYALSQQGFFMQEQNSLRESIWRSYYNTLCIIIQDWLPVPAMNDPSGLYKELIRAQHRYLVEMFSNRGFPQANQSTPNVEEWVHQAVASWKAVNFSAWGETQFTSEEKREIAEELKNVMFKAAEMAFHSTRIYRSLYMVHTALGEFTGTQHALKIYIDFIERDHSRDKRSLSIREWTAAVATLSAGIETLCTYGDKEDMRWGYDNGVKLQVWVDNLIQQQLENERRGHGSEMTQSYLTKTARAYRALGLSKATWARFSDDEELRASLLEQATTHYEQALSSKLGDDMNPLTQFHLATVRVEMNDIAGATILLKEAISILRRYSNNLMQQDTSFTQVMPTKSKAREITHATSRTLLLKCWHLLVLIVERERKYDQADGLYEAAFAPYGGKTTLSGGSIALESQSTWSIGEKRGLVSLKMCQVNMVFERMQDSEVTTTMIEELMLLYRNLFDEHPDSSQPSQAQTPADATPISSRRSFRKSLLHLPQTESTQAKAPGSSAGLTGSIAGFAGTAHASHQHAFLGRHASNKLKKRPSRRSVNSQRPSRAGSPLAQFGSESSLSPSNKQKSSHSPEEIGVAMTHDMPMGARIQSEVNDRPTPLLKIRSAAENMDHENPNPHPILPQPPSEDICGTRDPFIRDDIEVIHGPEPVWETYFLERRADAFFVDVLLFVASIYRRCDMFPDTEDSLKECSKYITRVRENISNILSMEEMTAEEVKKLGLGRLKSHNEMMANHLTERAQLTVAAMECGDLNDAKRLAAETRAKADYRDALNLFPNHVRASIGYSELVLNHYRVVYDRENPSPANDPAIATICSPVYDHQISQNRRLPGEAEIKIATAERDLAVWMLRGVTTSGYGWLSGDAWTTLGMAYQYAGDTSASMDAYLHGLKLFEGADIQPNRVLDNLV